MYVASAQLSDKLDRNYFQVPILLMTGLSAFAGFIASSSLVNEPDMRSYISLASGLGGVLAGAITSVKNTRKLDVKAEMFRGAAGQYRLMATRLEQRIRTHRNAMMLDSWKDPKVRKAEVDEFNSFFASNYEIMRTAQGEMKYFPAKTAVAVWKKSRMLLPNEVDQPEVDRADINKLMDQFV